MRISDWSSDVCSSDLRRCAGRCPECDQRCFVAVRSRTFFHAGDAGKDCACTGQTADYLNCRCMPPRQYRLAPRWTRVRCRNGNEGSGNLRLSHFCTTLIPDSGIEFWRGYQPCVGLHQCRAVLLSLLAPPCRLPSGFPARSEEPTSEIQSLMRIS